jgi:hypothetical protein
MSMEPIVLAFRAETADDAREQAEAWGRAERHVATLVVDRIRQPNGPGSSYFAVTVIVTLRATDQQDLGL